MKYFVCSDIESCYDEWIYSLICNGFDINNPEHKIIVCGDIFDCGSQVKEMISFIKSYSHKIILVKGNKEDNLIKCIKKNKLRLEDHWNGVADIFHVLNGNGTGCCETIQEIAEVSGLKEVLNMCLDYYETNRYVFVHGYIPLTKHFKYSPNWRKSSTQEWQKARRVNCIEAIKNESYISNKTIVCGHTRCSEIWNFAYPEIYSECGTKQKIEPFITDKLIALDSGVLYSGIVNVIVLEDKEKE